MKLDWQKTASILFCLLVGVGTLFLVGKYLLAILLPFLIALGLALLVRTPARILSERTGLPGGWASVFVLSGLLLLLVLGLGLGIRRLLEELTRLTEVIAHEDSPLWQQVTDLWTRLSALLARLPFLEELSDGTPKLPTTLLESVGSRIIAGITSFLTGLVRSLPSLFLFVIVTVIAAFYFAWDLSALKRGFLTYMPSRIKEKLPSMRGRARRFLGKYVRAYLFLMFVTFCLLFAGFTILGVDYAFLLAVLISVVDILPVLGVGTVVVPWALISLLLRDFRLGFGLLILWAVITVVRQIAEPKLVGGTLGLHPVITLVGMYVGYRLFGLLGMIAAPALAVAAKLLFKMWRENQKSTG